MPYNLIKSNGTPFLVLADSTTDNTSTSLTLVGKNSVNFGLAVNQNFINMMQNFANNTSPIKPLVGQLWYDMVAQQLKIYSGSNWQALVPSWDGVAGTIVTTANNIEITCILSQGIIVAVVSHQAIDRSNLQTSIVLNGITYDFGARFPTGIKPGFTLATDSNGYQLAGTATSATQWTQPVIATFNGAVTGTMSIQGGSNVTVTTSLPNHWTPNTYTKVIVSGNGLVTGGNVALNTSDITTALNYVPVSNVSITGSITGNAVVDSTGLATIATQSSGMVNVGDIILTTNSSIAAGWALCNGQTVSTPTGSVITPNLANVAVGSTRYIMRVY